MDKPYPAYEGSEPYIFVSYAHVDSEAVYPELIKLKNAGFNIWYDEGIAPGRVNLDFRAGQAGNAFPRYPLRIFCRLWKPLSIILPISRVTVTSQRSTPA